MRTLKLLYSLPMFLGVIIYTFQAVNAHVIATTSTANKASDLNGEETESEHSTYPAPPLLKAKQMNKIPDQDELSGHFSDPTAKAAVFKHVDDMTFIEAPLRNGQRGRRLATNNPNALWPDARVPYVISSDFSENEKQVILEGMRHWELNTCIRFSPRTTETSYIHLFAKGDGCFSFVGKQRLSRQPQGVSLPNKCVNFPIVVHELGHAIGFLHEHQRPDRNLYITVHSDNIKDGKKFAFERQRTDETTTLGYGYDYASIMHYRSDAFAESFGKKTISAKDEEIVLGGAHELSPLDILKANKLYGCVAGNHPPLSTFPQSAQPLTLPDGVTCGGVIEGMNGAVHFPRYSSLVSIQSCAWVIKVPDGYRIELSFPDLTLEQSSECLENNLQVFNGRTLNPDKLWGSKYCNSSHAKNYVSDGSTVTVYYHTSGSQNNAGLMTKGFQVYFSAYDIDECASARCDRCTNLPGSYRCECDEGYYHSPAAKDCYDVNECAYDNGGCEHVCDNTGGSYRCLCNRGYHLESDGLSCSPNPAGFLDTTCGSNNGGCEHICKISKGSHMCHCDSGYYLDSDGFSCSPINIPLPEVPFDIKPTELSSKFKVCFINERTDIIEYWWIDYTSSPQLFGEIYPNNTVCQATFGTHPWLLATTSGQTVQIIIPYQSNTDITLKE